MAAVAASGSLAGCGGAGEGEGASAGRPGTGGGGTIAYALPALPRDLDPLFAETRAEQVATRQVHEPLAARLRGPYGGPAAVPGLALSISSSEDRTVWRVVLRPGVRFRDGSPLDAEAVLANARRWEESAAGRELLPGLFAADTPRPGEVRFIFGRTASRVAVRLASPRLGIVSPLALGPPAAPRAGFDAEARGTGTGPFELAARRRGGVELARNAAWWGSPLGLGPALDAVSLVAVRSGRGRLARLRSGEAQITQPLAPAPASAAASDPLLRVRSVGGATVGTAASVRGIESASVPLLNAVWLTTIGG